MSFIINVIFPLVIISQCLFTSFSELSCILSFLWFNETVCRVTTLVSWTFISNLNKGVSESATLFLCVRSSICKRTQDKPNSVRAFHFSSKVIPRIMWRYLRLVGIFEFSPAQICLEDIQSYLSQNPAEERIIEMSRALWLLSSEFTSAFRHLIKRKAFQTNFSSSALPSICKWMKKKKVPE